MALMVLSRAKLLEFLLMELVLSYQQKILPLPQINHHHGNHPHSHLHLFEGSASFKQDDVPYQALHSGHLIIPHGHLHLLLYLLKCQEGNLHQYHRI